jgi:hypothetical protein
MRDASTTSGAGVTARALEAAIRRRGFVPGAPVCVEPFCRLAEMQVCRGMK